MRDQLIGCLAAHRRRTPRRRACAHARPRRGTTAASGDRPPRGEGARMASSAGSAPVSRSAATTERPAGLRRGEGNRKSRPAPRRPPRSRSGRPPSFPAPHRARCPRGVMGRDLGRVSRRSDARGRRPPAPEPRRGGSRHPPPPTTRMAAPDQPAASLAFREPASGRVPRAKPRDLGRVPRMSGDRGFLSPGAGDRGASRGWPVKGRVARSEAPHEPAAGRRGGPRGVIGRAPRRRQRPWTARRSRASQRSSDRDPGSHRGRARRPAGCGNRRRPSRRGFDPLCQLI